MNNKLIGTFILTGLLIAAFILRKRYPKNHLDKPKQFIEKRQADSSFNITYDLYNYIHPYLIQAGQFNDEKKYDSAIHYYKLASVKFEREKLWEAYVWVNGYIARLYLNVADQNHKEALLYLKKSLEKGQQALNSNHPFIGVTYLYKGLYYYREKMAAESLQMYDKALTILSSNYKEPTIYISDVYENIGSVYYDLKFDNSKAEKYYQKAVKIKEALPNKIKDSVLTLSYFNLVRLYFSIGDIEKEQTYCYKAIHYLPYVKSHRAAWSELLEGTLAGIYSQLQKNQHAIDTLKLLIRTNRKKKEDPGYLAFLHNSLGNIYTSKAAYNLAALNYNKAQALTRQKFPTENQRSENANSNYNLGMIFLKLKKYDAAFSCLSRCLNTRRTLYGNRNELTAQALQGIGNVFEEIDSIDSAAKYYQEALIACTHRFTDYNIYTVPAVSDINNTLNSFQIVKDKAFLLKQMANKNTSNIRLLQTSLAYYAIADSLMTAFRSFYERESTKLFFAQDNQVIYEQGLDCAALLYQRTKDEAYNNMAFRFMDKRKSSLLLEALNKEDFFKQDGISLDDRIKYLKFQQDISALQGQLENENSKENPDETILKLVHTRISAAETDINVFQENLYNKYPYYASIQPSNDTISLKDMQLFSHRNNSIVVEYFWGKEIVYIIGIYNGKTVLTKVKAPALKECLDSFQLILARGYIPASKVSDFASYQNSSNCLYKTLLKPVLVQFDNQAKIQKPEIVIIPDGPLANLPFDALVTTSADEEEVDYRKLKYLVKTYVISYDYSARLLLKNYQHTNLTNNARVLALSYSNDVDSLKTNTGRINVFRRSSLTELPGSAKEIRAISNYMDGMFYMGNEATEYIFKKEASDYDILHLAVHGEADTANSYHSTLLFKKGNDLLNDSKLYAYEIYGIPMKAKLAVLSACESGKGKSNPGEGIYSMARGFTYAGCSATVMSLWKVNDSFTADIIKNFYKHLSAGNRINFSVKKAKLDYINSVDRRMAHPSNWAAFVAMGNMSAVVSKSKFNISILYAAVIILITGLIVIFFYRKANSKI